VLSGEKEGMRMAHIGLKLGGLLMAVVVAMSGGGSGLVPYISRALPYSISYPHGWTMHSDATSNPPDEAFVRPIRTDGFADNVTIVRFALPASVVDQQDFGRYIKRQTSQPFQSLGTVMVAGRPVPVIAICGESKPGSTGASGCLLDGTLSYVFQRRGVGWIIGLLTPANSTDAQALRPTFLAMLATFRPR